MPRRTLSLTLLLFALFLAACSTAPEPRSEDSESGLSEAEPMAKISFPRNDWPRTPASVERILEWERAAYLRAQEENPLTFLGADLVQRRGPAFELSRADLVLVLDDADSWVLENHAVWRQTPHRWNEDTQASEPAQSLEQVIAEGWNLQHTEATEEAAQAPRLVLIIPVNVALHRFQEALAAAEASQIEEITLLFEDPEALTEFEEIPETVITRVLELFDSEYVSDSDLNTRAWKELLKCHDEWTLEDSFTSFRHDDPLTQFMAASRFVAETWQSCEAEIDMELILLSLHSTNVQRMGVQPKHLSFLTLSITQATELIPADDDGSPVWQDAAFPRE